MLLRGDTVCWSCFCHAASVVWLQVVVFYAGVGSQFLAIATGVLVMAVMGMFNVHRHGSIDIAVIILYALTSCVFHSAFSASVCQICCCHVRDVCISCEATGLC